MRSTKVEFLVGLFVLLGIVASIIMALKVAGLVLSDSSNSYILKAKFDNIGQLKLRAPVRIGGVLIGRVEQIYINQEDFTPVVVMEIESKYKDLSSESKASILTAGIIGEQYIAITPGFYDEEMGSTYLQNGDYFTDTSSAVILEDLIAKFLYSQGDKKEEEK